MLAVRERADALDRAAVLWEAEEPFRALAEERSLVEVFDLGGALLLTVSSIPCPIEKRPCPRGITVMAAVSRAAVPCRAPIAPPVVLPI